MFTRNSLRIVLHQGLHPGVPCYPHNRPQVNTDVCVARCVPVCLNAIPRVCLTPTTRFIVKWRGLMSIYVMLMNYTEQGIRNIKGSPKRADAAVCV